ncbi:SDR family NAD(P)-dependent oxidoreductase [Gordonia terrae]|uniref:SDR family NAD(P)-dependent oxidoreductase n=2 Tax=Gordonia terrae TaxID=2055 RepID=A0AAD0KD35_9ACTN|nr:SDR family oxidoreductase [Gordonia terrae]VTR11483.1 3-oxoacyl-ACP reductase [Clostridioides difficile]ANY24624.1 short-chain dehydrogenase [Gordonia terrae]AWO85369.1 SDR family NAD(P)-dependent oxidoreductase [Gordonia terrae]VTS59653.1 Diacetyl reductase [(S)-acetoin forming] [Gordonia terrae]GAB42700.1 putative oxidoreductase [Gordonia terrae NBRC 100016]
MSTFENKSVVVTGAGGGIGAAVARRFAAQGAHVVVADLDGGAADRVAADIGGSAIGVAVDVTDPDQVESAVGRAVDEFGGLDVLVNNAGIAILAPVTELSADDFDRMIAVNLKGVFHGIKAAVPHLTARGGGAIVNTASSAGTNGMPMIGGYAATKAAVINLTRTAAVELRPANIRVNCVAPAFVETALSDNLMEAFQAASGGVDAHEFFTQHQGRLGRPDDVARAVTHLAEDAGDWVTGHTYVLDGGFTSSPM